MSKIIEVTQKPIIEYSIIDEIAQKVETKIESLNIETLEPTEGNLSLIKSTRAELNNDFKTLEEQRKMVKDIVLKDYNTFEDKYKQLISSKFKDADKTLKSLVDTVSDGILNKKIVGIKEYFMDNNTREWIRFEDLELKIIKSKSDKKIKEEIDEYLANIKQSLETIQTLQNSDRVLAKFQMSKNLSDAISQTNLEIQREEQIKAQNEARAKAEQERKEQETEKARLQKEEFNRQVQIQSIEHVQQAGTQVQHEEPIIQEEAQKVFSTSFRVFGTREQFAMLKQFMNDNNIRYEGVSK